MTRVVFLLLALTLLAPAVARASMHEVIIEAHESFLYGAYAGLVFVPIHSFVARRCGSPGRR
jgi:hypothetical protein